jgi:phosphoglycolate phosphatase
MAKLETIIFDFDGTIADTKGLIIDCCKQIFNKHNLPIPSDESIEKMRALNAEEVIKNHLGVVAWRIPGLLIEGWDMFYKRKNEVRPYENMVEVISKLSENYETLVLSSNKKSTIQSIFYDWGLKCNGIYHSNLLFGKHHELNNMIKERKAEREREKIIYLGDEVRDIHACTKAGIRILPVTWGLNNTEAFLKAKIKPADIMYAPDQIIQRIEQIKYAV